MLKFGGGGGGGGGKGNSYNRTRKLLRPRPPSIEATPFCRSFAARQPERTRKFRAIFVF